MLLFFVDCFWLIIYIFFVFFTTLPLRIRVSALKLMTFLFGRTISGKDSPAAAFSAAAAAGFFFFFSRRHRGGGGYYLNIIIAVILVGFVFNPRRLLVTPIIYRIISRFVIPFLPSSGGGSFPSDADPIVVDSP